MVQFIALIIFALALAGCAGPNPNPGERSADMLLAEGDYTRALKKVQYNAEKGYPWAQLRLGVMYIHGTGVEKDVDQALIWLKKAAEQMKEGEWADGQLIGALGEYGYFNQNGDALIAKYYIGVTYSEAEMGRKNLVEAFKWAKSVEEQSNGKNLFYCCEFAGSLWISQEQVQDLLRKIENEMTEEQKREAIIEYDKWRPKDFIKYQP